LASLAFPGGTTAFGYDPIGELKTNLVIHSGTTLDFHAYDYNEGGIITKAYLLLPKTNAGTNRYFPTEFVGRRFCDTNLA
jgi:hypothetical protein